MMIEDYITTSINESVLKRIQDLPLFYPASGDDFLTPIRLFAPYIKDFWFVDLNYFSQLSPDHEVYHSAYKVRSILIDNREYMALGDPDIQGDPIMYYETRFDEINNKRFRWISPCIRTERYKHLPSDEIINIHRRRGFGSYFLANELESLGVFFYRNDSQDWNSGGSKTLWLTYSRSKKFRNLISEVLRKLVDGGLIVTDGSNCKSKKTNSYRHFARFKKSKSEMEETLRDNWSFTDQEERIFECLGYIDERRPGWPTFIWQVNKP